MDIPPAIPTQPASKVRPVLVRVAFVTALCLAVILLVDCVIHHQIVRLFIHLECFGKEPTVII
jgi:hypothetical protein